MMKTNAKRFFTFVSVAVALACLTGCFSTATNVQFRYQPEDVVSKADALVRTGKIYRDLDTIFIGDMMWNSYELRHAYLDEMKSNGRMDDEGYAAKLDILNTQDANTIRFIAAFYTSDEKWDDFENPQSIWKLRLVGKDGSLVAPATIVKTKMENMPDAHIYRFITQWKTIYSVSFPRNEQTAGLAEYTVKLYSILGDTNFQWVTTDAERAKPAFVGQP